MPYKAPSPVHLLLRFCNHLYKVQIRQGDTRPPASRVESPSGTARPTENLAASAVSTLEKTDRNCSLGKDQKMTENRPNIVVIAGPTASGKTSVGVRLGQRFQGEIVSADSVQIYRYLDVGSAKPTPDERASVPHHMIDIRDPDQEFSAGDYMREAREIIDKIGRAGRVPLVVGGTGLYIKALLGGIVELPLANRALRRELREQERTRGEGTLFGKLMRVDPEIARRIHPQNVPRIVRALEVYEVTGTKLSDIQRRHSFRDRPFRHLFVCLDPGREILYERIDNRVDSMIERGLIEEVNQLLQRGYGRDLKSMQSLGYRHAAMVVAGETDRDEAIRLMKRDTRRYAKRQLTWFRSESDALWFDPRDSDKIESVVENFLGR